MFGYIRFDKPYLYIKDHELYQAAYCGVCKAIGNSCGQTARFGLSYDSAFLSVLCHNIKGVDLQIERQSCITKFGVKRSMANVDELTKTVGCLNSVMLYYKLCDDMEDEGKGGTKRLLFVNAYKKAKKQHPKMVEMIDGKMREQQTLERAKCDSPDRAADPTASMMAQTSDYLLQEHATEYTRRLFYAVGKWIYLIDAVDDYDTDRKKGNYNPFLCAYGAESRAQLMEKNKEDVSFLFGTLFYEIRECLANIQFHFNRDLIDNVLLRGIPLMSENVLSGRKIEKQK